MEPSLDSAEILKIPFDFSSMRTEISNTPRSSVVVAISILENRDTACTFALGAGCPSASITRPAMVTSGVSAFPRCSVLLDSPSSIAVAEGPMGEPIACDRIWTNGKPRTDRTASRPKMATKRRFILSSTRPGFEFRMRRIRDSKSPRDRKWIPYEIALGCASITRSAMRRSEFA